MIVGTGVDMVDIRRIERLEARFGERFISRILTDKEQLLVATKPNANRLAKYLAAKEACIKALSAPSPHGIGWHDMEVGYSANGKPTLTLHGAAASALAYLLIKGQTGRVHLSLTDEPPYALAYVVIEAI